MNDYPTAKQLRTLGDRLGDLKRRGIPYDGGRNGDMYWLDISAFGPYPAGTAKGPVGDVLNWLAGYLTGVENLERDATEKAVASAQAEALADAATRRAGTEQTRRGAATTEGMATEVAHCELVLLLAQAGLPATKTPAGRYRLAVDGPAPTTFEGDLGETIGFLKGYLAAVRNAVWRGLNSHKTRL